MTIRSRSVLTALCVVIASHCLPLLAQEPPATLEFRLAVDEPQAGWKPMSVRGMEQKVYVSSDAMIHGGHIEKVSFYNEQQDNPAVGLSLTDEGGQAMIKGTSENRGKRLAIVLNQTVVSAPVIRDTIGKDVQITGRFDNADLLALFRAIVLREQPQP